MSKNTKSSGAKRARYTKGDALEGTNVDLNSINFKNKDVMRWNSKKGRRRSVARPISVPGLGSITKIPRL